MLFSELVARESAAAEPSCGSKCNVDVAARCKLSDESARAPASTEAPDPSPSIVDCGDPAKLEVAAVKGCPPVGELVDGSGGVVYRLCEVGVLDLDTAAFIAVCAETSDCLALVVCRASALEEVMVCTGRPNMLEN